MQRLCRSVRLVLRNGSVSDDKSTRLFNLGPVRVWVVAQAFLNMDLQQRCTFCDIWRDCCWETTRQYSRADDEPIRKLSWGCLCT